MVPRKEPFVLIDRKDGSFVVGQTIRIIPRERKDRKDARKLPKGTYFIADLIGLDVYTDEGNLLGKVNDIFNRGSSDIYSIKNDEGKEILLPAIEDVIKQVDLDNEKIIVHIIDGLL